MTRRPTLDDIFSTLDIATWSPADQSRAFEAATLAMAAYDGHTRDQGTTYIWHPLEVVTILREELHVTAPRTLLLGLLHDALERSPAMAPRIQSALGHDFAEHLRALTPDHRLQQRSRQPDDSAAWQAKTSRLPPESLLVRLADRIHNLRDLRHSPDCGRRERFVTALTDYYLPLAASARTRSPHLATAHAVLHADFDAYIPRPAQEAHE